MAIGEAGRRGPPQAADAAGGDGDRFHGSDAVLDEGLEVALVGLGGVRSGARGRSSGGVSGAQPMAGDVRVG